MVAVTSRSARWGIYFVLLTFFLSLIPEHDAEAKRKGGRGMKRGGAAKVSAKKRGGKKRGGGKRQARGGGGGGAGRGLVARNNNNNNNNNNGNNNQAVDEDIFGGDLNGRGNFNNRGNFGDFDGGLQQVVINGEGLALARDRNGRIFAVRSDAVINDQGTIDPFTGLVSNSPLPLDRNGNPIAGGFDSSGRSMPQNVVQSIRVLRSGGRSDF